jgi:hypothetical protein
MPLQELETGVIGDLMGSEPATPEDRATILAPAPAGTLEERWHVYASGYLARLVEAVENDYPAVRRILGEGPFRSLVARYARSCPPRSYDIGRAGDRLAEFLETDPLAETLPFLPDLARFEWALAEAFVAADDLPLSWDVIASLPPDAVADLPLALHPGVAVVRSQWPLFELRDCQDLSDEAVAIPVQGRPVDALVYRRGLDVARRALACGEADLLMRIRAGETLGRLTDVAGDVPSSRLAELFRLWVSEGLIVAERAVPT